MNFSCFDFSSLINTYTLAYICNNYNIYCDDYCMTDITDTINRCYCCCDSDKIYCYEHNYFLQRFFSVLFVGLLFACVCYFFLICICKYNNRDYKNSNTNYIQQIKQSESIDENLPKYDELNKL